MLCRSSSLSKSSSRDERRECDKMLKLNSPKKIRVTQLNKPAIHLSSHPSSHILIHFIITLRRFLSHVRHGRSSVSILHINLLQYSLPTATFLRPTRVPHGQGLLTRDAPKSRLILSASASICTLSTADRTVNPQENAFLHSSVPPLPTYTLPPPCPSSTCASLFFPPTALHTAH